MEYDEYKEQLLTSLIILKEQRDTLGTLFYVNPEWKKQVEAQYPEKIDLKETKSKKYIAIDQGLKPFMACRTNDELISIGSDTSIMIKQYLKK